MEKLKTKDLILIGIFTAILSVASLFIIPIGPVPITLQTFFFLLIPALLGPSKGLLTIVLYMILGLIGFPVFAGGVGGFQALLSPSFGYIIGALFTSLFIGKIEKYAKSFIKMSILMLVSIIILYLIGAAYQYILMNGVLNTPISLEVIILTNLIGFLPMDLLKAILASFVYARLSAIPSLHA